MPQLSALPAHRITLVVALLALGVLLPIPAFAGQVFGHVSGHGCSAGARFVVMRGNDVVKTVRVNADGNYAVFLDPGTYTVRPEDDRRWHAVIRSLLDPIRQDIDFQ